MENNETNQTNNQQVNNNSYQPIKDNNNKGNSNGLIVILIILLLVLIGVILYVFVFNKKDSDKQNSNNNQPNTNQNIKQPENINDNSNNIANKETEVNLADYEKIYDKFITADLFYKIDHYNGELADENLTFKSISNSYFLDLAISDLEYNDMKKIIKGDYDLNDDNMYYAKVSSAVVDSKVKELFGNINYKNQSTYFFKYNSNDNFYYIPSRGGMITFDDKDEAISIPIKATTSEDMLYIYGIVGVVDFKNNKMYSSLNKSKEISAKIDNCVMDISSACKFDGDNIDDYIKKNKDNFSQYKYSFKKSGASYQFVNLEKIN